MKKILFVCHGNIHRSVIAEICLKKVLQKCNIGDYEIISRGLQGLPGSKAPQGKNLYDYPTELNLSQPYLDRIGITIPKDRTYGVVDETILSQSSLILVMEKRVLIGLPYSLVELFPQHCYKARLFREFEGVPEGVPDCAGISNPKSYEECIGCIDRIISTKYDLILQLANVFNK